MIAKRAGERAQNLGRNPSCGGPIRPERGIGIVTESRTNAESGVGIHPEAHADSAAKYDSDPGWEARSESDSESESQKSYSVRARNRARYGPFGRMFTTDPGYRIPKRKKTTADDEGMAGPDVQDVDSSSSSSEED